MALDPCPAGRKIGDIVGTAEHGAGIEAQVDARLEKQRPGNELTLRNLHGPAALSRQTVDQGLDRTGVDGFPVAGGAVPADRKPVGRRGCGGQCGTG